MDHAIRRDQQVAGFDVLMQHAVGMGVLECAAGLKKQADPRAQIQSLLIGPLIDRDALDQAHREPRTSVPFHATIQQGGDVGMVELRQVVAFAHERVHQDGRRHLRTDALQCDLLLVLAIGATGFVDRAHTSLRQYAVDVPGPQHGAYAGEGRGIDTVAVASGVLGIQRIERPALKRIRGRIGLQQPSQGVVKRRLPHPQCGEGVRTSPWRQFDVLVEQVERTGLKIGH